MKSCDADSTTSRRPDWLRFRFRRLLVYGIVASIAVCAGMLYLKVANHRRAYRQMELAILRLATTRAEGVPENRWNLCVVWTWNLHCGYSHRLDTEELRCFADDINRALDGPVDLATIDWIWDEYLRYEPSTRADAHHRPTLPNNPLFNPTGAPERIDILIEMYELERAKDADRRVPPKRAVQLSRCCVVTSVRITAYVTEGLYPYLRRIVLDANGYELFDCQAATAADESSVELPHGLSIEVDGVKWYKVADDVRRELIFSPPLPSGRLLPLRRINQ